MMFFFIYQRVWKTVKCQEKPGKSQGSLRWMISGNPEVTQFLKKKGSKKVVELLSLKVYLLTLYSRASMAQTPLEP